MDEQAVSEFTQSLAIVLSAYGDATNKLNALEAALKEHDPVLYGRYLNHLETARNADDSGTQVALALARLKEILDE